ncbi:methyl-accepting chemotaxis protein [Marinomonas agarivorans]|nr:methyl-accepting chemotaxis protein [Marinomonas agarivorans]
MLKHFSFKAKLITLLFSSIIGFVVVALVALNGLSTQQQASNRLQSLLNTEGNINTIALAMMERYEQAQSINNDNYESSLTEIENEKQRFSELLDNSLTTIESEEGKRLLTATKESAIGYFDTLTILVNEQKVAGLDINSGLMGEIGKYSEAVLESISFLSLLKQDFLPASEAQKQYIFDPTEANKALFTEKYDVFYKRIVTFGLEDQYGETIKTYFKSVNDFANQYQKVQQAEADFASQKESFFTNKQTASDYISELVSLASEEAESSSTGASYTLIFVSILVTILASALMITIGRSVNVTLNQIIVDLTKVEEGDLTARLPINSKRNDEFDQLCGSVNKMTSGLSSVIGDVVGTSTSVNKMVNELNIAVVDIADSNKSVNVQTNSLATATEEISTTISNIADTTNNLSSQAQGTYKSAQNGAETIKVALDSLGRTVEVVNQTSQQLNELGQLSTDIDEVIGMINDLANQTNLLALNAAIEAARAGEAGRGFSVVADEVRSLAEKTVEATSKITDIVHTIQSSTTTAITTMQSGQENLTLIEEYGEKAGTAMHEIEAQAQAGSTAASEMAHSIQEVAKTAVHMSEEMDAIAQQLQVDTNSIDTIATNTTQIHSLVDQLNDKTKVFKTE